MNIYSESLVSDTLVASLSVCLSVSLQGFVVSDYQSFSELTAVFQELNMTQLYQQVLPSLNG